MIEAFNGLTGQGPSQIAELGAAFILSAAVGLERELEQKAAGLRTYTVVGLGAALFMLVSKYGFSDVLATGRVTLDPSRVAAQIVSGLGFIGGGIIFVKRDSVRGLTTAASIWLTAAVGAAAGAGLVLLAALGVLGYFAAILALPALSRLTRNFAVAPWPTVRVHYLDGHGLLREVLQIVTRSGFRVTDLSTVQHDDPRTTETTPSVEVSIHLDGRGDFQRLISAVSEVDGVLAVAAGPNDAY
ncbi:MgtC/SapB family protein [Nocardia brasiliensis]|uniref:MgtC/SapB family protein n=1 Tax=Nocardia brasiliensis TaxID=37326 RepID=UPI0033C495B7